MNGDPRRNKRIGIITFSKVASDSRVQRQIYNAAEKYEVVVVGEGKWVPEKHNISYYELPISQSNTGWADFFLNGFRVFLSVLPGFWHFRWWRYDRFEFAYQRLRENELDLIHINDDFALPSGIAAGLDSGCKTIFDAHEFSPDQKREGTIKKWLFTLFTSYIIIAMGRKADAFITVSEGIAGLYRRIFGFDPCVIMNAPLRKEPVNQEFKPEKIRIIHHGQAAPKRNLELLIDVASRLDKRYSLHFLLTHKSKAYLDFIKEYAKVNSPGNVFFHPPVSPNQIVDLLGQYDVGIHILIDDVLNHKYALPNKFFDFISAGLAVVIGPSPEMVKISSRYDFGIVAPSFDPETISDILNSISPEEILLKKEASRKASYYLNGEIEMDKLSGLYDTLLQRDM